jgi:hypothetical protein
LLAWSTTNATGPPSASVSAVSGTTIGAAPFAVQETAVFRLMFGQEPSLKKSAHVVGTGHACFQHVIDQVALYCKRNKVRDDAQEIALKLWTFVHGAASLLIDQDYNNVAPEMDVNQLIASATPGLLGVFPRPPRH